MKVLKIIVITFVAMIAVLLIVTAFLPSDMIVERTMEIEAPPRVVFNQVNDFRNWENWSYRFEMDPHMQVSYSGPESGEGAKYDWVSDSVSVGEGSMIIMESEPDKLIKTELSFFGEKFGEGTWNFVNKEGKTIVNWQMVGELGFFKRWVKNTMEQIVGENFQKGLDKLGKVSEDVYKSRVSISIVDLDQKYLLAVYGNAKMEGKEIREALDKAFGRLIAYGKDNRIQYSGPPLAITKSYDKESWEFYAAMPFKNVKAKAVENIEFMTLPAGKYVRARYRGPYGESELAYGFILKYMKENGLKESGNPFEEYLNDPAEVEPDEILTNIYFPVE